jgi:hypothetical protein
VVLGQQGEVLRDALGDGGFVVVLLPLDTCVWRSPSSTATVSRVRGLVPWPLVS